MRYLRQGKRLDPNLTQVKYIDTVRTAKMLGLIVKTKFLRNYC